MITRNHFNSIDVNIDVLWSTVRDDLPLLKRQIDRLLTEMKRLDTEHRRD